MTDVAGKLGTALADRYRTTRSTSGAYNFNGNHAQFDVLPGDSLFVFVRTGGDATQVVLVANWLDELRGRAGR